MTTVTTNITNTNIAGVDVKKNDFGDVKHAIMPFNILADNYGVELAAEQLRLEHEAYELGEARFLKALERQAERGEITENAVGKPLMATLIPAVSAKVTAFVEAKGRGKPHVAKKHYAAMCPDAAAFIGLKVLVSALCAKKENKTSVQTIGMAIGNAIQDEQRFGRIRDEEAKHYKERVKPNLAKRQGEVYKKAYMEATEAGMLDKGELQSEWTAWEKDEVFHVGLRMIEMVIESTGLAELHTILGKIPKDDLKTVRLSPEYAEKLAGRAHALAGMTPMHQPTIVPPKPWTEMTGGGYWAKGRRPLTLIRVGSKKALQRYSDVDMPEVYHAVNTIQNTAWKVHPEVLAVVNAITSEAYANCPVEDVPSHERQELPERPEDMDTNEEACKAWKKSAAAIYRKEAARISRRMSMEFALEQANKFSKYDAIYFPHNLDWRGRVYAVPMLNPQGSDMTKGLLTFANKEPIGTEGGYWLAVHGANCAGVDKVSLDDRVQWVKDNEQNIIDSANSPLDCTWWTEQDDASFCLLAFCCEWRDYCATGKSANFMTSLPLAFDGTCSGLQHFSAMLRDKNAGTAVNLTPSPKPQDIYGIVAKLVMEECEKLALNGTADSTKLVTDKKTGEVTEVFVLGSMNAAKAWLNYGITRSVTKRSVMTLAYGSKEFGFRDQVLEDTIQPAIDSGKGWMFEVQKGQMAGHMAKWIWNAVTVTVTSAVDAMKWLQDAAKLISSDYKDKKTKEVLQKGLPVHWCTPAGFPIWSDYQIREQKTIDTVILGGTRLQLRLNVRDANKIDASSSVSGIAPNFIHSMDASHLMLTVNDSNRKHNINSFAMIHDSFGCHAGKAHLLFKSIREVLVETYTENDVIGQFYENFCKQVHKDLIEKLPEPPKKGDLDLNSILESLYTFS